jgi:methylamine dehydrogenase heavy chain
MKHPFASGLARMFVNRGNARMAPASSMATPAGWVGMVNMYGQDSFAFDPLGRNFYVVQTIWSKRDRGVRQDMLLAYDVHTLKLAAPESMRQFRDSDKRV